MTATPLSATPLSESIHKKWWEFNKYTNYLQTLKIHMSYTHMCTLILQGKVKFRITYGQNLFTSVWRYSYHPQLNLFTSQRRSNLSRTVNVNIHYLCTRAWTLENLPLIWIQTKISQQPCKRGKGKSKHWDDSYTVRDQTHHITQ